MQIVEYIVKAFLVLVIAWVLLPALASIGGGVVGPVVGLVVAVFGKSPKKDDE